MFMHMLAYLHPHRYTCTHLTHIHTHPCIHVYMLSHREGKNHIRYTGQMRLMQIKIEISRREFTGTEGITEDYH